ncbi:hypothetical protein LSH36_29g03000 [Paralvinella palmiformis]|uniref:Helicase ATP-binding domain-containing protein n=1 Tax=Paralvinella palmiformis TaxID=53620 RepID=A0AAD9NG37_9ANNE|nr:hypothetical protein LSH36_29g03000 [Paralvinella palmiformis]
MAKLTDERKLIRLYMPLLEEYLISTFIVQDLEQILGRNGIQRVSTAEEASFKSGVHELLELLMNSEQPGWFSAFINALNENAFFNRKKDEADIRTESAEEGIKSAMFLLLLRLPQQKRFWVRDFITALRLKEKESYQTLAHTIEAGINDEPLELRSYQRELAEPAIDDKNVIIVAPTGSGKTHVALYITENHLKVDGGTKVVFLVPTTELVSQQTRMYRTYLSRFSVCGLSGEVQGNLKVPLSSLIEKYNIIVMTPQILLNALRKNDIQSLKVFTLMVFDECHHATKEHPYNNIMAVYLDEKYLEDRDYLLPQIVGLTASVGVGSARDLDKAREHILSLCANLDAVDGISIVVKHEEELKNHWVCDKIETRGRHEDPFRKIVSDMMKDIEDQMRKLIVLLPVQPPEENLWVELLHNAKDEFDIDDTTAVFSTWRVEGKDQGDAEVTDGLVRADQMTLDASLTTLK